MNVLDETLYVIEDYQGQVRLVGIVKYFADLGYLLVLTISNKLLGRNQLDIWKFTLKGQLCS